MSTNSVLAVPNGDAWRGRYCHWDGNPQSKVPTLRALIERDGIDQVIKVLTEEHHAWSVLRASYGETDEEDRGEGYQDVKGYGSAYADEDRNDDVWHTSDVVDAPWAYVIYPKVLSVLWGGEDKWHLVATLRHDLPVTDEDLIQIECGAQYERCPHYAWVHFPEVDRDCHYSTLEWLAFDAKPALGNATHVILENGKRFEIGGGGGICFADGTSAWRGNPALGKRPIYWACYSPGGGEIVVGRRTKAGLKLKYPIVLPPNAVRGEVVVPAGEVIEH
jgi:hypothetical protein